MPNLRVASLRVCDFFFWREQVLCSTFCHLRASRRFEVELAARRLGTKPFVGSPLGDPHPLSSPRMKKPLTSLFNRPHNTDSNRNHSSARPNSPLSLAASTRREAPPFDILLPLEPTNDTTYHDAEGDRPRRELHYPVGEFEERYGGGDIDDIRRRETDARRTDLPDGMVTYGLDDGGCYFCGAPGPGGSTGVHPTRRNDLVEMCGGATTPILMRRVHDREGRDAGGAGYRNAACGEEDAPPPGCTWMGRVSAGTTTAAAADGGWTVASWTHRAGRGTRVREGGRAVAIIGASGTDGMIAEEEEGAGAACRRRRCRRVDGGGARRDGREGGR